MYLHVTLEMGSSRERQGMGLTVHQITSSFLVFL